MNDEILQKIINENINGTYLKIAEFAVEMSMNEETKKLNGQVALQEFATALYKDVMKNNESNR